MAHEYETDNTLLIRDGETLTASILGIEDSSFEVRVEPRSVAQLLIGEAILVVKEVPTRRYPLPTSDLEIISEHPLRARVGHLILEKQSS